MKKTQNKLEVESKMKMKIKIKLQILVYEWFQGFYALNQLLSVFIYYEERKAGRKEDREVAIRRERGWREVNVKPQNKK